MKRMMKKWLSLLLTAAMILSLGVTALAGATDPTQDVSDSSYRPSEAGNYVDSSGNGANNIRDTASNRTISASLTNEGALPDDIVRLILPVVSNTTVADTFDMYLDPNDLLQASFGARYGGSEDENPFAEGTHVYFKHAEADEDGKTYSKTSDKLSIVNKSNVDVKVSLDAAFNKGDNNGVADKDFKQFSFVKEESELENAKGAAMFLEMQAVVNTAASGEEEASTSDPITGAFEDLPYPGASAVSVMSSGAPLHDAVLAQENVSFIDSVEWAWSDAADEDTKIALNEAFDGLEYTFTYDTAGKLNFKGPDASVVNSSGGTAGALYGYGLKAPAAGGTASSIAATATSATEQVTGTVNGKANTVLATITFNLNRNVINAEVEALKTVTGTTPAAQTVVTFAETAILSPAKVETTIPKIDGAYDTIWHETNTTTHAGEYRYQLKDSYTDPTQFNSMDFNLTAAINTDSKWEEINTGATHFGFDVVWTITPIPVEATVAPSVTVTSATTGTSGQVVMDVDLGSGAKAAATVKQFTYTTSANAAQTLAVTSAAASNTNGCYANGVLTIKTPAAIFGGSNWKVVFTLTDGSDFEVPVDIKTVG